jgi:hypothetical protein
VARLSFFCNFQVTLASNGSRVYGFAFLDYAALKIWVGSLQDDDSSAALGALLVQVGSLLLQFVPFQLTYQK